MGMIGPTFARELGAAGLIGAPISWEPNGNITGRDNLTAQQNAALDAVIAAHNPAAVITDAEIDQGALNAALTQDGSVVRALAELTFQEINKLRVRAGQVAYTKQQFIDALKANMRA